MKRFPAILIFLILLLLPAIASAQLYRCDTPKGPLYQNQACEDSAQQRELVEDRVSTIPRGAHGRSQPRPKTRQAPRTAASVGGITRLDSPDGEHPACKDLRVQIRRIDAAARQRSTQRLTDQRRAARTRMYDLDCPNFPSGR